MKRKKNKIFLDLDQCAEINVLELLNKLNFGSISTLKKSPKRVTKAFKR